MVVCVRVCVWGWLNVTYAPDMTGRGHWENSQPISTQKKIFGVIYDSLRREDNACGDE